ncbi:hypothetical protein ABTY96_28420 [Streptomyces sp. NPDC096057]|uniref:hypothetical protein n=1 Tax=Streptomyces sp. NPDC096057 TaxID=3155543 RepID=UPI003329C272
MNGLFGKAADLLEFGPGGGDAPMCVHHGPACEMGTVPLSELYRMVIEAKRQAGEQVPPLDEHLPMTVAERRQYRREFEAALADTKAAVAAEEAAIREGRA